MFAVIWNFLIAKTAGENPESLEMGTRIRQDGGFSPLTGPSSGRCECEFSFRSSRTKCLYTRARKLPRLEYSTSKHSDLHFYSETQLPGILSNLSIVHGATSHGIQRIINDKTKVVLTTRAVSGRAGASNLLGTVKHQYSPRLNFEVCISATDWIGGI